MTSEERLVCWAAAKLIERTGEAVPGYARRFAPASTMEMAPLYARTRTRIVERRFESGAAGMALPDPDTGGHLILLDSACLASDRWFTLRHELAHILSGEVEEALFLGAEGLHSFSERRADLFAVADLTPTRWMDWVRGKRRPWKAVTLDVVQAYRELTDGWSEQRLWDRARLRVQLYRDHGI